MTKHECAIIMAYTGVTMLQGDDFQIFHGYVESLMNRPVWTHQLPDLDEEIKKRARPDFIRLCREAVDA